MSEQDIHIRSLILYLDHHWDLLQIVLDELNFQKDMGWLYSNIGDECTLSMLEDFAEEGMLPLGININAVDLNDFITYYLVRQRDELIKL